MIRRFERLLYWTVTLCAAAGLCRAELGLEARTLAPDARLTGLAAESPVRRAIAAIVRDPFAGAPEGDGPARLLTSPPASDAATAGVSVPDIDTTAANPAPATQLIVRAAIVGPNPVAYVDDGSGMQIVRIGDVVGGRNVGAIDLQGIAFTDGTRLDLPAGAPSGGRMAAAEPAAPATRTPRSLSPTGVSPSPAVVVSPSRPELLYATPAPLRTVDARGLAPGVNPTPDLFDPTPFSYPYPYPPPH